MKAIDLVGKRFGRLVVLARAPDLSPYNPRWECICDCGNKTIAQGGSLKAGNHLSCGCLQRETATKHGMDNTPTYWSWIQMRRRCANSRDRNYGKRGIRVCKRWEDFNNFFADMGIRPEGMTLDRIDNNGDYSPHNCRWASMSEQSNNRRTNRLIEYKGEVKTLTQWARIYGISPISLTSRLKLGWTICTALTEPIDHRKATKRKKTNPA